MKIKRYNVVKCVYMLQVRNFKMQSLKQMNGVINDMKNNIYNIFKEARKSMSIKK